MNVGTPAFEQRRRAGAPLARADLVELHDHGDAALVGSDDRVDDPRLGEVVGRDRQRRRRAAIFSTMNAAQSLSGAKQTDRISR